VAIALVTMTFMVSVGLSQAGSIRVSNALGKRNFSLLRLIGKTTLKTSLIYGASCAVLLIILRTYIPLIFTEDTEVIQIAAGLILFAGIFQISDSTQAISAGLLRGVKDVQIPTVFIGIAYWVVGLPLGSLLAFYYDMGAKGIWIGLIAGLTTSAILLSFRFKKKIGRA